MPIWAIGSNLICYKGRKEPSSSFPAHDMDTVNLLPSQPHLFTLFFRLALSLLTSLVNANYRRPILGRRSHIEFDINTETGFFPPRPLPRLRDAFSIWEQALADANDSLALGSDVRQEATSKRHLGEVWRRKIRTVSSRNPVRQTSPTFGSL